MDLTNIDTIKSLLKQEKIWPDKRLGQNFLIDHNTLMKIVETAQIDANDMVVEIGPGLGTLTQELAKNAKLVLAIEKDRDLVEWLRRYFKSQSDKVKVVCDDILQYDLSKIIQKETSRVASLPRRIMFERSREVNNEYKVVSNLPYNITSPVIRKFVEAENPPSEMVLMVQKEVAQRLCAKPGNRERGLLTVLIEYFGTSEIVGIVPRTSFYPVPDVDSAIIKISHKPYVISHKLDYKSFLSTTKIGFSQKRRQIHHPLKSGLHLSKDDVYDILEKANIKTQMRAEDISLEGWIELTRQIKKKIESSS